MAYTFSWVPTPNQNNSFTTNNSGTARVILDSTQNSFVSNPYNSPLYICIPPTGFQGGDSSAATLYDFAKFLATSSLPYGKVQQPAINYNGKPLTGGRFTLNGNACGNYEYNILPTTTLTQTTVAALFSSTLDISSWIIVRGNLTLGSSTTLIPNVLSGYTPNPVTGTAPDANALRRLFMVVYVTGTLTVPSGSYISMSACGGNSGTTGANIASFQIPIASNITGGTKNPFIASAGGAGGTAINTTVTGVNGADGVASSDRYYTGGGGSGYTAGTPGTTSPGSGGAGSCFSGGTGGGTITKNSTEGTSGSNFGGAGGTSTNASSLYGGTGNPGGGGAFSGNSGTGGILIIIVEGAISASAGAFAANGVSAASTAGGGASGGGIVIQLSGDGSFSAGSYVARGTATAPVATGGNGTAGNYSIP